MSLRVVLGFSLLSLAAAANPVQDEATSWAVDAELVESCCCDAICPCMVGSKPTLGYCEGNRLVEIVAGHYGDVRLDGVQLILTFRLREWSKLYFDQDVSDEQMAATGKLLEQTWASLLADVKETEKVPLKIERKEGTIAYSAPKASTLIEVMRGADDKPIKVQNLRSFKDYTQYKSVEVTHTPKKKEQGFDLSGTNGFTARFKATSEPERK